MRQINVFKSGVGWYNDKKAWGEAMLAEKRFMEEAIREAELAAAMGETPVGAVVVKDGVIVSRAHNMTETLRDGSAHAELIALKGAAAALGTRYLNDCVLYVTLEPCPMCAGACMNFRIGAVVYGAYDKRAGAFGSVSDIGSGAFGQSVIAVGGMLCEECAKLLNDFFREIR